jgi:hypothetical protein
MDLERLINELCAERTRLDAAILALEKAATGLPKRRGRPPKWMARIRMDGRSEASKPVPREKEEAAQ